MTAGRRGGSGLLVRVGVFNNFKNCKFMTRKIFYDAFDAGKIPEKAPQ